MGQTVTEAARALGITRVALSRFLNEQAALSPDMGIRLDKTVEARYGDLDTERLCHRQGLATAGRDQRPASNVM